MFSAKILHGAAVLLVACYVVNAARLRPYFYREIDGINSVLDFFIFTVSRLRLLLEDDDKFNKKHEKDCIHNLLNDFVNCNIMKKVLQQIQRDGEK